MSALRQALTGIRTVGHLDDDSDDDSEDSSDDDSYCYEQAFRDNKVDGPANTETFTIAAGAEGAMGLLIAVRCSPRDRAPPRRHDVCWGGGGRLQPTITLTHARAHRPSTRPSAPSRKATP